MNRKAFLLILPLAVLAAALVLVAPAARVAEADVNGCPASNTIGNRLPSDLVGAYFATNGNAVTYYFNSFVNRNPSGGVPGLIEYCIYPDPATQPDNVVTVAVGADGSAWIDPPAFDNFSFGRPGGNPSNIPLDGTLDVEMGTATWNAGVPAGQTILLHINDAAECDRLYGGNPGTCWVLPGERQLPQDLTVTKTANPSFKRTFDWNIVKSANPAIIYTAGSATFDYTIEVTKDAGTDSDFAVGGTITVHNPNAFDVAGVDVTDATPGGDCAVVNGTGLTVPAGGEATADYTCTFAANPGSGTNTATATWTDFGSPHTSAQGTADFVFGDPTTVENDAIDVVDTNGGSWHFTHSGSVTYQMTFTDPAGTCTPHDNTATIVQLGDSSTVTVTVCVGADLQVSKDANPSFKRAYEWDITKDVAPTFVKQAGGTATFNYTVHAFQTGYSDSEWAVSGTIHVVNPNDWQALVFDAADAVEDGGVCTVAGGTGVTVAAGGFVDLPYTCTFAVQPHYFTYLTNTATATWDSAAYYTPHGSASGTADFRFMLPTTTEYQTVTITDTFDGVTTTLGTLTATDAAPWASATFTYPRSVPVPTWDCVSYTNTAAIIETGDEASQTVTVCGPVHTGALTMGFWQNKNGQAVITSGAATLGICNSGIWLRQYAPFQDLSPIASCRTVASYVVNVIKAANASGASMNAMLKAQMLATALDVYFSDPALGGNRIGAPAPIGGVAIDLTQVCKNIGGGCTIYEDVSPAFGGAPSLTVAEMLAYAAGQSNPGGSLWYGNVKAMQELAKDAFDAINNQKVFAP